MLFINILQVFDPILGNVKVKVTQSCPTLCGPHGLYSPWNSPGHNTGVGGLFLFQGIFPTQGLNLGLLHSRQVTYCLSHLNYKLDIDIDDIDIDDR